MEQKFSIVEKLKLFIFVALLGFAVFVVYLDNIHKDKSFTDLSAFKLPNPSNTSVIQPLKKPSNTSVIQPSKEPYNTSVIQPLKEPSTTVFEPLKESNISSNGEEEWMNKAGRKKCDMFDGKWVYRPEEAPEYDSIKCPFVNEKFSCQSNGRQDSMYENWRWEARNCEIPVFNGTNMLERLRNKRMILVGDSLNRNMFESLACLLFTSVPSYATKVEEHRRYTNKWVAKEHNFTLEFFWTSFLVDINNNHESGKKVLVLDKLSPTFEKWTGADIMVFNSGHWWELHGKSKAWELLEFKGQLIKDMPLQLAYKHALKTWATWIKRNVDPYKTTVFFRGYSPVHKQRQYDQWCYNRTEPIMDDSFVQGFPKSMVDVVESQIKKLRKSQVIYLNTTKLSEHRIDAHPSLYITKDEKNAHSYADCSHWCLPGVPDTWNRLLYASLYLNIWENVMPSS